MLRMRRAALIGLASAAVAGVVAGLLISGTFGGRSLPPARARVYANVDACLLTGPSGIAAEPDSLVWAGMEGASQSTRARVSYLAVTGPATEANAAPFLGSLLARDCRVIVAADAPERAAVAAEAAGFRAVRFVVVGGKAAASNVTVLPASLAGLQAAIVAAVS